MLDTIWNLDPTNGDATAPTLVTAARALWALVNADTWEETYQVLIEQQTVLLHKRTRALLRIMIDMLLEENEVEDAENWRQYIPLLEEAAQDIQSAWQHFVKQRNEAIDALEALSHESDADAQQALFERYQAILHTDTARVILRGSISKQQEEQHYPVVTRLEKLLRLLEQPK